MIDDMTTELQAIRARLDARKKLNAKDRKRQAELVRERLAQGYTWRQIRAEAGISQPTIALIVKHER